ncbi:hypothetical protein F1559_004739 [Cyanidiococcus yangmingshanensis]|uniref:Ribonuclease n=1 Tax=Cyanidiococcus yangmingshanensis TaxID=2690220 RepID=A0A7J7IN16_9RHOD|nr:hypothetical protein F1559_004739 [Cyanidiococcus yangmingshanensis]
MEPNTGAEVGVGIVDVDVIDTVNILQASVIAMQKAIQALRNGPPTLALIDGTLPETRTAIHERQFIGVVHGDAECMSIAAASIIAKVTRDRLMGDLEKHYPGYEFADNKGYPTPRHLYLLNELGPSAIHRRTYAPVKRFFKATSTPQ